MTTLASSPRQAPLAPSRSEAPPDPLDFARGLALALPISLLLWMAIVRVAWGLWQ